MRLKRALSIMLSTAVLLSGIPACADQGEIGEVEVQDGISELPGDNQEFIESVCVCQACGKTLKYAVPTSMKLWWRDQDQLNVDDYQFDRTREEVRLGDK